MTDILKTVTLSILIGVAVLFFLIGVLHLVFGDISQDTSFKPLFVIVPILGALSFIFIKWYKTNNK